MDITATHAAPQQHAPPQPPAWSPAAPTPVTLALRFCGSGAEYFRIWVVNLLLMLVTVGLYYPWARVRRFRYFYNHTLVGGHALDFHGQPLRMLRGMLIFALFMGVYSYASRAAPVAGAVGAIAVCALWPLIWRGALRFRLANTSWRGLRFRFDGDVRGAFIASGLPTALILLPLTLGNLIILGDTDPNSAQGKALVLQQLKLNGGVFSAWALLLPWFIWRAKNYQQGGVRFAQLTARLDVGPWAVYRVFIGAIGVQILAIAVGIGVGIAMGAAVGAAGRGLEIGGQRLGVAAIATGVAAGYLVLFIVLRAYLTVRMQNLVWNNTAARWVRFQCDLPFWPTLGLFAKNWLFIMLTLGLYWPFAAAAVWRHRVQAVSVRSEQPIDTLVAASPLGAEAAVGDLAADLGGIDVAW